MPRPALLALLALACRQTPPPPPGIGWSGCQVVHPVDAAGDVPRQRCLVADPARGARLWLGPTAPLAPTTTGSCAVRAAASPTPDSTAVDVVPGDAPCVVRVGIGAPMDLEIVTADPDLPVCDGPTEPAGCDRPVVQARCLEAWARATAKAPGPSGPPANACQATALTGIDTTQPRAAVRVAVARRIAERYAADGWTRQAEKARLTLAYQAINARRDEGATGVSPDPADLEHAQLAAQLDGQRALLRRRPAEALPSFERAEQITRALGSPKRALAAADRVAQALIRAGRHHEALDRLGRILAEAETVGGEDRGWIHNNVAWALILVRDAGVEPSLLVPETFPLDPRAHLDAAAQWGVAGVDVAVNRAIDAVQRGELDEAATALQGLDPAVPGDRSEAAIWRRIALAHLLGAADPAAADRAWQALSEEAAAAGDLEIQWRATVERASLAARAGDVARASALHRDALSRFDDLAAAVPLADRLDAFLSLRQGATGRQVGELLAAGQPDAAFDVARRYHRALLERVWGRGRAASAEHDALLARRAAAVDTARQARDTGAPADALHAAEAEIAALDARLWDALDAAARHAAVDDTPPRPPRPGEALLLLAPEARADHGAEVAWRPMLRTARGVTLGDPYVHDAAAGALPPGLAAALRPLVPALRDVSAITFLVPGALDTLDLALVDLGDGPLAWRYDVAWSLDLPDRPPRPPDAPDPPATGALLLGNPSADPRLTGWVAAHLDAIGSLLPAPQRRHEGALAPDALPAWIAEVDVLHYAGHAIHDGPPLDAGLVMQGSSRFRARDALLLPRAPARVSLAACEGAETGASAVGGLGLASAFLLAGSEVVAGSAREVQSHVAFRFFEVYHRALAEGTPVPSAWRTALRTVAEQWPDEDWRLFRLVVAR